MKRKWPVIVLFVLLLVIVILAAVITFIARGGLPKTSGVISAGVNEPVEIYRDQYGVPHIIAASMEDLFFAQGYAQAQDRLWQMDMSRRGVGGKLSEILGEEFIETDLFTLTVGFYRAAEKNYQLFDPETLALFEAYSAGVNAFIEENYNRLSPEFILLGYKPELWTPIDSLAIGVYMSWYLGSNMQTELFHTALIEHVGFGLASEIFPDYPDYGPVIISSSEKENRAETNLTVSNRVQSLIELSRIAELNGQTRYVPGLGSNNWVISGDLASGKGAILANDMHLAMGLPSIWHTAHLVVEDRLNITGVVFPGVPGIIVGFNEYIAWGFTNTGPDVQDLYVLELNPDDPKQYLYMDEWVDAEIVIEEFSVKGENEPRQIEVMISRFGPVISSVVDLEIPLSLKWTALEGTREFAAILGYMEARNWEEFTEALEDFATPTQNMVYADREGNIGYRANGLIPIRRSGNGLLPADGTTDQHEWIGYIPYDELPTLYNPPGGIIVTANHRVVDDDYPYFITASWAPPYRAMSIWREYEGQSSFTLEDMIKGQSSLYNTQAEILGPVLVGALERAELSDKEAAVLELFRAWLDEPLEPADSVGPSIYNTLYMNLLEMTFSDEMGEELYERFLVQRASTNAFDRMLLSGESGWFNDVNTESVENRDDIILNAFRASVSYLDEEIGGEPTGWQWGKLHTITFKHNLGSVALLARFYNRGPDPVGGSFHTPANMSYQLTEPFRVTHSAPWRYMVDMTDRRAFDALAIGNSGHFLSKHYDDQHQMWLDGEYKEMIFEVDDVKTLKEKLTLEPR
ncbi:MAG: penicillin acylase family protein [Bacillota bacterium]|nr:penicillin acylase family protein [Bacillota bacterium]